MMLMKEGGVTERNAICAGATIGAFVGGAAAYLFFTSCTFRQLYIAAGLLCVYAS